MVTICELSTLFAGDADKVCTCKYIASQCVFYLTLLLPPIQESTSLLTIFRHSAERCQIIFKSDPLKDAINGSVY